MSTYPDVSQQEAVLLASRIASSTDREFSRLFEGLRRRGRLSATVHQLNRMLAEPAHREIAALTLKRMGLHLGG
jgi:hypothetical protein